MGIKLWNIRFGLISHALQVPVLPLEWNVVFHWRAPHVRKKHRRPIHTHMRTEPVLCPPLRFTHKHRHTTFLFAYSARYSTWHDIALHSTRCQTCAKLFATNITLFSLTDEVSIGFKRISKNMNNESTIVDYTPLENWMIKGWIKGKKGTYFPAGWRVRIALVFEEGDIFYHPIVNLWQC